jgi:hypothetical protein
MPEYFSQSAYARRLGLSRAAISKAVNQGRIYKTSQGIDPANPTNSYYESLINISRHGKPSNENVQIEQTVEVNGKNAQVTNKNTAIQDPKNTNRTNNVRGRPADPITLDLVIQGRELDNKLKALKLSKEKIEYFEKIRKSIPATVVARAFAQIGASVQTQFMMFDERSGESLFAEVKSGCTKEQFQARLRQEIGDAMRAVIETTEKMIETMKTLAPGGDE